MQQLIDAEAQNLDDLRIEPIDRPLRERARSVIERRPPALHAGRDLGGERAIAVVRERAAARVQSRSAGRRRPAETAGGSRTRPLAPARSWRGRQPIARPRADGRPESPARVIGRLALGLQLDDRGVARPGGHVAVVAVRREDGRRAAPPAGSPERRSAGGSAACRPGTSAACGHGCSPRIWLCMSRGGPRPVDQAVVLRQPWAHRSRRASSCGVSVHRPRCESVERRDAAAPRRAARDRCSTSSLVSSAPIGRRTVGQHRPGIERLHDAHDGHAGFALARDDRAMDGRGAAIARQQRRVHVDHAEPRRRRARPP